MPAVNVFPICQQVHIRTHFDDISASHVHVLTLASGGEVDAGGAAEKGAPQINKVIIIAD